MAITRCGARHGQLPVEQEQHRQNPEHADHERDPGRAPAHALTLAAEAPQLIAKWTKLRHVFESESESFRTEPRT